MNCLGCQLANHQRTVYLIWENEDVSCILDYMPFNEGHVLILPKRHARFLDDLDEAAASSVFQAAKLVTRAIRELYQPDGITVCQNGGVFDELMHFHLHIIPRYEGQDFADFYKEDLDPVPLEAAVLEEVRMKLSEKMRICEMDE